MALLLAVFAASAIRALAPLSISVVLAARVPIWPLAYSSKPSPSIVVLAASVPGAADRTFSVACDGVVP